MLASEFEQHPELGDNYWGEHPGYPVAEWASEALNNDTRVGYWDWVRLNIEQEEDDE